MSNPPADTFNLPDRLTLEPGRNNLARVGIDSSACRGRLYLQGACCTQWAPVGHQDVLYTCRESFFEEGQPIRGGVPVCFPWFGPNAQDPSAPAHGLVRTKPCDVVATAAQDPWTEVELTTDLEHLRVDYQLRFGPQLELRYTVSNTSEVAQTFEVALHTYLSVGDAAQVSITGLEHTDFIDKMQDSQRCNQGSEPVTFTQETDRVYVNTSADCVLHDPVLSRRITVAKTGSHSTVVWNPWIDKAARLADMGDDEWTKMCCIESCNVGENAVALAPGASHTMTVTLSVEAV